MRFFLIDLVILGTELARDLRHALVPFQLAFGRSGDDQRGAGLIDEDVIDLIHDGVVVAALHAVVHAVGQVITQVVETELGVGAIGDIGGVGLGHASTMRS